MARHDMAVGLLPLFRVLPQANRQRREIVLEQKFAGSIIRIRAVEMSIFEQGVLLALLSLGLRAERVVAGPPDPSLLPIHSGPPNEPEHGTPCGNNQATTATTLTISASLAEVARTAGLTRKLGSHTRAAIDAALARLAMATILVLAEDGRWALTHLISGARGRGRDSIHVQINARAAQAILGERSYAAISMREWRALSSDVAKALYSWLQAWFAASRADNVRKINLEKLIEHAYGNAAKSKSTQSMRRKACLHALSELTNLGWCISVNGTLVTVSRCTPRTEPTYAEY